MRGSWAYSEAVPPLPVLEEVEEALEEGEEELEPHLPLPSIPTTHAWEGVPAQAVAGDQALAESEVQ